MKESLHSDVEIESESTALENYLDKRQPLVSNTTVQESLKKGIWLYFFLLIFEGGLRKWLLPGLATPLLIVRDPVAIWLLYTAWKYGEFPTNIYVWTMSVITLIGFFTAITLGHGSLIVALYGVRILLFHFPLIFLIGKIFDREDVIKMAKVLVILAIPMTLLIALQFYSPQSAFINKGIGADSEGGGFSGALGFFRPPGTFSFTTGNTQFFSLVGAVIIYFWLYPKQINRVLLLLGTISLLAAIPLSISRSLFVQVALSAVFATVFIIRKPQYLGRMFVAGIGLIIIFALLGKTSFFSQAIDALTTRFDQASDSEGDLSDTIANRIFAGFFEAFKVFNLPFFGFGIGMGTNAGAKILVGRSDEFLIAEGEWGRMVGEMGALLGTSVIIIRMALCVKLLRESYKKVVKGDLLSWLLLSVGFLSIAQGQWAQPTALGFGVVMGGLLIASLKDAQPEEVIMQ